MTLDFRFKSYKCHYFIENVPIEYICFSKGCGHGKYGSHKQYAHVTYIWPKKHDNLNYCFLDNDTVIKYFTDISKLLGFKLISFCETKNNYKLQISVIADHRYFLYVSTYIRYVYEYPFSLLLYCALRNQENFPELNITHIMQFYIAMFHNGAWCHCPGKLDLAYRNINSKSQFNLIRDYFNDSKGFIELRSCHNNLTDKFKVINIKNLPQVADGINNIINNYYARYKKSICCR